MYYSNEHIYIKILGQWTTPLTVSGQSPPPTSAFIIERISGTKGLIYGGATSDGPTNSVYIYTVDDNTSIVSIQYMYTTS